MRHCDICEEKTNNDKRCDSCIETSIRMDREIQKRLALKRSK